MKEIIISYYDSGVWWSIASGHRVFDRDSYRDEFSINKIKDEKLKLLCSRIEYDFSHIDLWIKQLYPLCEKLTICENGNIIIKHFRKEK